MAAASAERRMGIHAFDRGWQFPAITEQHAYHRIRALGGAPPGVAYVAYPWATLIDKVQVRAADAEAHLDSFRAFCLGLPEAPVKVTVCQHILMRDFAHLFAEAGVSHVFWSHTTQADLAAGGGEEAAGQGLRLYPFPLYPVQIPHSDPLRLARTDRRWLYSFVGMRPNGWYLTQARAWIIDRLRADPRGHVIARDDWHYKQIVYRHQVLDRAPKDAEGRPAPGLVDDAASAQFRDVLYDSTFALCPSGTGPNSIRLWEAMMAGSIPVIIAGTYAPPGDPRLWEEAVVFCDETEAAVAALPGRLAALARDPVRMAGLRAGLDRLRLLYGPHGFVPDVAALMQSLAHLPPDAPPASPLAVSEPRAVRTLLARVSALLLGRAVDRAPERVGQGQGQEPGAGSAMADEGLARAALPATHPVRRHYDRLTAQTADGAAGPGPASGPYPAPRIGRGMVPAVHLAGPGRTPLHYPALRRWAGGRIAFVADPARADLIMAASLSDLQAGGAADGRETGTGPGATGPARAVRLILSEAALPPAGVLSGSGPLSGPVWLNPANSDIFRFDRLPYALVRDDQTLPRLAGLMAAERDLTAKALRDRWRAAPARAALWCPAIPEGLTGEDLAAEGLAPGDPAGGQSLPPDQPVGASLSLDGLVLAVAAAARAAEEGAAEEGPAGKGPERARPLPLLCLRAAERGPAMTGSDPADPDLFAHLDKLARLDGRAAVIAAFEPTCHPDHVGITALEAIALQARPAAVMGAGHRLRELIPAAALIDLFGLTPVAIAGRMLSAPLEVEQAEAVCAARAALRTRLAQPREVLAERQRIVAAVLRAVFERV
jgi:hypothetical protein